MRIRNYIPGFVTVLLIALLSSYISSLHASFDPLVISLFLGMALGTLISAGDFFTAGAEGVLRTLLPAGIALYGSQLVFKGANFSFVFTVFLAATSLYLVTLLTADIFGINRKMAMLLSAGLSICGASAIAVISPVVRARKADTSVSVIAVMMLGLTGMICYPILLDFLPLTRSDYDFFVGATLPMLGQVLVASGNVGPESLASAMEIKLIRVSLLIFPLAVSVLFSGTGERKMRIPWFIKFFFFFAVLANVITLSASVANIGAAASVFLLSAGLAAIGLTVDLDAVIAEGIKPLGVIIISWGVTNLLIYIVRNLL